MNRKTQIFSLDLLIAILAFLTILTTSIVVWDYTTESITTKEKRNDLEISALHALSSLIETTGNPANWSSLSLNNFNETNVKSLGLIRNDSLSLSHKGLWEIDSKKLNFLNSSTINTSRKILGLHGYKFNLTLKKYNGSTFNYNYSVSDNFLDKSEIVRYSRFALFENTKAEIILKLEQNE